MKTISFNEFTLKPELLTALSELGYEKPTPVQEKSIPILIKNQDLLAQAQTGTGKTAAFALPIITQLDIKQKKPQALIIVPTRELAIQVAEAFQSYAKYLRDFHVIPIYGGQAYKIQLRGLQRGTQVIVGTPGRIIDHLKRGTIFVDALRIVVLDEADEMLKMGFIEDIEWILQQIPQQHQTALFSATLPVKIQKVAHRYLKNPQKVQIKDSKNTVEMIEQVYIKVAKEQKLNVLTRCLEIEEINAAIVFTRTKNASTELAEKLQARGYAASALNGDMTQSLRKKVIERMKNSTLDVLVATDVAARGIDIQRISHVINYDIPYDTESYVHRIGRTGRAGRKGKALLFVTPREKRLLKDIERSINKRIKEIETPSQKAIQEKLNQQLTEKIMGVIGKSKKIKPYRAIIETIIKETAHDPSSIAASLAYLIQQTNPLITQEIENVDIETSRQQPRGRDRLRYKKKSTRNTKHKK